MRVSGAAILGAPADAVWAALTDRDVLARSIPGCEKLHFTGKGRCEFTLTTPIAAVAGRYAGHVSVLDQESPRRAKVAVAAAGVRGKVDAAVTVRLGLAADGGTEVGYEADAEVSGAIAGIGQLIVASIGKRIAAQFLDALDAGVSGATGGPPEAASEVPMAAAEPAAGQVPRSAIAQARRGIGLRGERGPALDPVSYPAGALDRIFDHLATHTAIVAGLVPATNAF